MATFAATTAAVSHQLSQKEQDIQMMLAAEVHLGTKNCDFQMERYVFKRRNDGNPRFFWYFLWGYTTSLVLEI